MYLYDRMNYLNQKQQKVYDFYERVAKKTGSRPTYAYASEELGLSPSVVFSHVKNIRAKGLLLNPIIYSSNEITSKCIDIVNEIAESDNFREDEKLSRIIERLEEFKASL